MPTCVLRYCKSRSGGPDTSYSFFSFPPAGNRTRKEWIKYVQKERREDDWQPSSASKLCSKHFKHKDIKVGKTGRACLKKGSLPYDEPNKKPSTASSGSDNESESESRDDKPDSKEETDVESTTSESKSNYDDPEIMSFRVQVDKLQKERVRHRAKIKNLDQQNQLLKRKLGKLKNFVIHLVKKYDLQITGHLQVEPRKERNL